MHICGLWAFGGGEGVWKGGKCDGEVGGGEVSESESESERLVNDSNRNNRCLRASKHTRIRYRPRSRTNLPSYRVPRTLTLVAQLLMSRAV